MEAERLDNKTVCCLSIFQIVLKYFVIENVGQKDNSYGFKTFPIDAVSCGILLIEITKLGKMIVSDPSFVVVVLFFYRNTGETQKIKMSCVRVFSFRVFISKVKQ